MAWTSYQVFLALLLVITGSLNTLTTKWADKIDAPSSDGITRSFNHPFTQSLVMFLGEMLCLLTFKLLFCYYRSRNDGSEDASQLVKGNRTFSVWIFFIPAMCDMVATSIMYVGLNMTYASSFQMLRGSLIAFVALLSVGFLGRKINSREWFGIFLVMGGLIIVGVSDFVLMKDAKSLNNVITGDLLIIIAQIISAIQIVAEEHFVAGQDVPPLQAVGWEGTFGFAVMSVLLLPMYFIHVGPPFADNPRMVIEDFPDAMQQIYHQPLLVAPILGTIFSIAFFNFAGISVTKEISAATRTVLDSVRTLFIWMVTISLGWQDFSPIQILGFFLLVLGMFVYNDFFVTTVVRHVTDVYRSRYRRMQPEPLIVDRTADDTQS